MRGMQPRSLLSQTISLAALLFLLVGCTLFSGVTPSPGGKATFTLTPAHSASPALDPTGTPGLSPEPDSTPSPGGVTATAVVQGTATPTSCTGWMCTLEGVVYVRAASSGNELPGTRVTLSHFSNCSPTQGEHETVTGLDGAFEFEVYLHDTDTFWFEVEEEGYEPVRLTLGGFDCLFCSCPPFEIVLKP